MSPSTFHLVLLWSHSHDSCLIYKRKLELSSSCPHVVPTVSSGDRGICQLGPFLFSCRDNRATVWVSAVLLRSQMSDPAPTSQEIPFWDFMDGVKLSPRGQFTWSVVFLFFFFFFPCSHFFLDRFFFFWVPPSLNQIFFSGNSYLLLQLPSTTQPIYLPPSHLRSLPQRFSCHHHHKRSLGGGQQELVSLGAMQKEKVISCLLFF